MLSCLPIPWIPPCGRPHFSTGSTNTQCMDGSKLGGVRTAVEAGPPFGGGENTEKHCENMSHHGHEAALSALRESEYKPAPQRTEITLHKINHSDYRRIQESRSERGKAHSQRSAPSRPPVPPFTPPGSAYDSINTESCTSWKPHFRTIRWTAADTCNATHP